jgi:hypothetical protein
MFARRPGGCSRPRTLRVIARRSLGSELRDAHLLQQGQVVLDVPIVGDPVISTFTRSVAMNSIGCPFPCVWPNLPVKWPVNFIWIGNVIAGDDHLFDPHCQVGHRGAELTRCERWPLGPLWAPRRQGMVCEGWGDRPHKVRFVACIPELVEGAGGLHSRVALALGD